MNKRVAAVMAAGDCNSWSLAVVPTWRSKVVEETNSIFKIWCGNIKLKKYNLFLRLRWKQSALLGCKAVLLWANLNPLLHKGFLTLFPRLFRVLTLEPSRCATDGGSPPESSVSLRNSIRLPWSVIYNYFVKISDPKHSWLSTLFYLFYLLCAVFLSRLIVMLWQTKIKISNLTILR